MPSSHYCLCPLVTLIYACKSSVDFLPISLAFPLRLDGLWIYFYLSVTRGLMHRSLSPVCPHHSPGALMGYPTDSVLLTMSYWCPWGVGLRYSLASPWGRQPADQIYRYFLEAAQTPVSFFFSSEIGEQGTKRWRQNYGQAQDFCRQQKEGEGWVKSRHIFFDSPPGHSLSFFFLWWTLRPRTNQSSAMVVVFSPITSQQNL